MKTLKNESVTIIWFRQDLRLTDNPALTAAVKSGNKLLPVYIFDQAHPFPMGECSQVWLHHSLRDLNKQLSNSLCIKMGHPHDVFQSLLRDYSVNAIFWNRCYEPWRIEQDTQLKTTLKKQGLSVKSFNGNFLFDPLRIAKENGQPYKIFTPFYRNGCIKRHPTPSLPEAKPTTLKLINHSSLQIDDLDLLSHKPWEQSVLQTWLPGEQGAKNRLNTFLAHGLKDYKEGRNYPAKHHVSSLSPHLHFGEISPRTVWYKIKNAQAMKGCEDDGEHFLSELGWREFSNYLLYHFPSLPEKNLQAKFDNFPWTKNTKLLACWKLGQTGIPIIDAGMRQLWQTGYIHNRVRMIVASFLVKNLMIDWRQGADWFWHTLLDADLANNSASWQWVAGCGTDAAPYFRIFNPVTQGKKFDPQGQFVRQYVPELVNLPDKYIHNPFDADSITLKDAKIKLGVNYPLPVIDLKSSRNAALSAYQSIQ